MPDKGPEGWEFSVQNDGIMLKSMVESKLV